MTIPINITHTLSELQKKIAGMTEEEAIDVIRAIKASLVSNNFVLAYDSVDDFPSTSLLAFNKDDKSLYKNMGGVWTRQGGAVLSNNGYQTQYIALTSGTLVEVTHAGNTHDLNATIDGMSDGDALLLSPGEYSITPTAWDLLYTNDPIRGKNICIAGDTFNPKDVVVKMLNGPRAYYPIFGGKSGSQSNALSHFSSIRLQRVPNPGHNYASAISGQHNSAQTGYAKNVIFDFNNGAVSWKYTNSGDSKGVHLQDCSFVNYSSWLSNYSGSAVPIVEDCAFDDTYNSSAVFLGTNPASITFDGDYAYTSAGVGHMNNITDSAVVSISIPT